MVADLFAISKMVRKYEEEKPRIEILQTIVTADKHGRRNVSICFPQGADPSLINFLREYGFKAHNIEVKDPNTPGAKACCVQW